LSRLLSDPKHLNNFQYKAFMVFKLSSTLAFLLLLHASCNKVIEEVPALPFDVFPNPCKGQFSIVLNPVFFAGDTATVKLLDGDEILTEGIIPALGALSIDMSDRSAGVYHIEVTGKGQTFIAPVLKVD